MMRIRGKSEVPEEQDHISCVQAVLPVTAHDQADSYAEMFLKVSNHLHTQNIEQ